MLCSVLTLGPQRTFGVRSTDADVPQRGHVKLGIFALTSIRLIKAKILAYVFSTPNMINTSIHININSFQMSPGHHHPFTPLRVLGTAFLGRRILLVFSPGKIFSESKW